MPEDYWQPDQYPYSELEAQAFLEDLQTLTVADMESLRISTSPLKLARELSQSDEWADLAKFQGRKIQKDPNLLVRQNAHKVMLWQWHLENYTREISKIEQRCAAIEKALSGDLAEFREQPHIGPDGTLLSDREIPFLGNWKTVLVNAATFIPPEIPIWLEKWLGKEIMDFPDLEREAWTMETEGLEPIYEIKAPLWRIIGKRRRFSGPSLFLADVFNAERSWFVKI